LDARLVEKKVKDLAEDLAEIKKFRTNCSTILNGKWIQPDSMEALKDAPRAERSVESSVESMVHQSAGSLAGSKIV
jgi:hypothetical protein